jgi:hypothetical protein
MPNLPALQLISDISSDFLIVNNLGFQTFPQNFPNIPNITALNILARFQNIYSIYITSYGNNVFTLDPSTGGYEEMCTFLSSVLTSAVTDSNTLKALVPSSSSAMIDVLNDLIAHCDELKAMIPNQQKK